VEHRTSHVRQPRATLLATLAVTACAGVQTMQPLDVDSTQQEQRLHPMHTAPPTPAQTSSRVAPSPTAFPAHASTASTAPVTVASPGGPTLGGCRVFPSSNPWNQDISHAPLDPNSAAYVTRIDSFRQLLHPDFGSNPSYGIPYAVVPGSQPLVPITFTAYGDESDPGPYPIPLNARVEQGSDAHVLVADSGNCRLYELFDAHRQGSGWAAGSGAVFNLASNALRPDTWTSADAAGLPILPGLVRYDEVAAGVINHALRFTVDQTQDGFIHPATHQAGVNDPADPPMGLRLPPGVLRPLTLSRRVARHPDRTEEVRDARRRQRQQLVHQRRHGFALERHRPRPAQVGAGERVRGRRYRSDTARVTG